MKEIKILIDDTDGDGFYTLQVSKRLTTEKMVNVLSTAKSKSMEVGIIICALNDLIVDLIADSGNVSKKEAAKAAGAALLLSAENYKED